MLRKKQNKIHLEIIILTNIDRAWLPVELRKDNVKSAIVRSRLDDGKGSDQKQLKTIKNVFKSYWKALNREDLEEFNNDEIRDHFHEKQIQRF